MIKNNNAHRLLVGGALGLSVCVSGCESIRLVHPGQVPFPPRVEVKPEQGVVIATSSMALGLSKQPLAPGKLYDCGGPAVGIKVGTAQKDDAYLYNAEGQPCDEPTTLFNGGEGLFQRAADPSVQIGFHDALGPIPAPSGKRITQAESLKPLPAIKVSSQFLVNTSSTLALEEPIPVITSTKLTSTVAPDALTQTLMAWKNEGLSEKAKQAQEEASAAGREVTRLTDSRRAADQQQQLAQLLAELREKERRVEEEKRKRAKEMEVSETNRQKSEAALQSWQQKQAELQSQLESTQTRLKEFESQNQRLAQEKARQEQAYSSKVATLSGDLKAAEAQASSTRQELILQAAAKIAEAEQLANAAKVQEQEIKLREAARMRQEAEQMMQRALDIQTGKSILADVQGIKPTAAPLALEEVPVIIHAKDAPIETLTADILKQAEAQAGKWTADWQLSAKSQYILKEKWSLTAEAPVSALFDQLKAQVKAAHGIALKFTQFSQSRLLVITDE